MIRMLTVAGITAAIVLSVVVVGCGRAQEAVDGARQAAEGAKNAAEGAKAAKELHEKGETEIETDKGKMKIKKDDENVEWSMESKDGGEMTMSGGADADISGLEIPVYPGAEKLGAHTMNTKELDRIAAQFSSEDDFDAVADFYKDQYPDADETTMSREEQKMLILGGEEDGVNRTVTVVKKSDEDVVNISLVQQKDLTENN